MVQRVCGATTIRWSRGHRSRLNVLCAVSSVLGRQRGLTSSLRSSPPALLEKFKIKDIERPIKNRTSNIFILNYRIPPPNHGSTSPALRDGRGRLDVVVRRVRRPLTNPYIVGMRFGPVRRKVNTAHAMYTPLPFASLSYTSEDSTAFGVSGGKFFL